MDLVSDVRNRAMVLAYVSSSAIPLLDVHHTPILSADLTA
jgi:hypothetical protein